MSKSTSSGIPGMDAMTDTFDFFKNMWSGMPGMNLPGIKNIPGMVMPTLSVDEIDKQIKDLKAVESWLTFNLNMLQGTIQALEVQKATISTLQTMGESFSAAMQPPKTDASTKKPASKPAFESPFTRASSAQAAAAQPAAAPAADPAPAAAATPSAPAPANDAGAAAIPPLANPAAWWGMLQDQFKQAVDTAAALTPEAPAPKMPAATATPAASKTKAKAPAAPRKRKTPPKP